MRSLRSILWPEVDFFREENPDSDGAHGSEELCIYLDLVKILLSPFGALF